MAKPHTLKNCQDPVSVSWFLKRLGVSHKRLTGVWKWDIYNQEVRQQAWITSSYKVIAIGQNVPMVTLEPGELLISVPLPWSGCGTDMAVMVSDIVRRHNASLARHNPDSEPMAHVGPKVLPAYEPQDQ